MAGESILALVRCSAVFDKLVEWARSSQRLPTMAVFFTSDTHFGDHRVFNIRPRPFGSLGEMDDALISRWNLRVGTTDEIWHLGGFAATVKVAKAILPKLNGRKHLVAGNNDSCGVRELDWASVQTYAELTMGGTLLVLCHYPFRSWNGIHRGSLNLHGHSPGAS